MTTNWAELFANPEIDPAVLLPLVSECQFDRYGLPQKWYSEQGRPAWEALPVLWENPAFALMPLDTPALRVLAEPAERCWLEAQFGPLRTQLHDALGGTIRERSMPLLEEVMRRAWFQMHPLVTSLWNGRVGWPYFHVDRSAMSTWPDEEWQKIFRYNRFSEITSLEFSASQVIYSLQYDFLDSWVFISAVRARCLLDCERRIHRNAVTNETTKERRLFYLARLHLIDHLKNDTPIDWDIVRAAEEAQ